MKADISVHCELTSQANLKKSSSGGTIINCVVAAFLVILVAGLTAPMVIRCPRKPDQTEAVNNARQIGLALSDFKDQFGQYPDSTTIGKVREQTRVDWNLGTKTSNDFFRQLLAGGSTQSEKIFYAKVAGARKPDDLVAGSSGLEKGECAFAYFMGAIKGSGPLRPLAITPVIPGTDRFDPKPFNHKAVMLRLDNSVTSMNIDREGHVIVEGRNLMDPLHPIWDGHPPVIAWPEL